MSVSQSPTQHMSKGKKRSHEETSIHPPRPSKKAKTHSAVHNSAASSSSTPFVKPAKGKGKGRETDGGFRDVKASLVVSIPPVFAKNLRLGVEEMLDSMVMRYIPALEGVVLSHSDLTFLNGPATILGDSPFAKCKVGFNATVWCPQAGMKLTGRVNLCSPDHISLLVHRTFNVSIPRNHIPTEDYEFEYGAAENDPEYGPRSEGAEEFGAPNGVDYSVKDTGTWVSKTTGQPLGGDENFLEFTVIGLTVANEMLSLKGSIQPDPFSAKHAVVHSPPLNSAVSEPSENDMRRIEEELDGELEEDEENIDAFQQLGKKGDLAAAEETRRVAEDAQKMDVDDEGLKKPKKRRKKDREGTGGEYPKDSEKEAKRKKAKHAS